MTEQRGCYHCGRPLDKTMSFHLELNGEQRQFCCPSCLAVAGAIHEGGLDQFYQYRSQLNQRPEYEVDDFSVYDREDIQTDFVDHESGQATAYLLLSGITCAACVWLIEKHIMTVDGVVSVRVNASTHQCKIVWRQQEQSLSHIMAVLAAIGYRPQPLTYDHQDLQRQHHQRTMLMRLAVAAFGMMQVGMVAIALYAGDIQGMDEQFQRLFRWVSLLVATPVVIFSAQPFWSAAWKNILQKHLTMDVPVSLAIVLAYLASAWATWTGSGEVYFDSVSMFTFFLLLGRYLELRTRYRNYQHSFDSARLLPLLAQRVYTDSGQTELVSLAQLNINDVVRVASGDTIPCDGVVIQGKSAVIESLLTGESEPVMKTENDKVIAGSVNTEGTLLLKATAVKHKTRLSTIEKLVTFAQQDKPALQIIADKVASCFVAAVLVIATLVFIYWWQHEPDAALWITLSVLVVTCPCALSLATPTALTAAVNRMRLCGLLVLKSHVIETLTHITSVVFDKTGTLTKGLLRISEVVVIEKTFTQHQVLQIAASLEQGSSHPIARAFLTAQGESFDGLLPVAAQHMMTGQGVAGHLDWEKQPTPFFLGKPHSIEPPTSGQWLLLAYGDDSQTPIAWIRLSDQLRESAAAAVSTLKQQINVEILSGDRKSVVADIAQQLDIDDYYADVNPEEKLHHLKRKQQQGMVLMVGDGINDAPVLAQADVSVAMDSASDFARVQADTVLLSGDLQGLAKAIAVAHQCQRIMKQNITWALLYNITALPLAAMGLVPPYLAAIGMSLSSLIVVANALRITR